MISRLSPEQYSMCPVSRHSDTASGVGVGEEFVDELLGVDVGVNVRMESDRNVVLLLMSRPSWDRPSTRSRHCSAVRSTG